ncbi:hypothetical protein [Psychrobacillus sp. FJAT-21963]|uniref:hypothetical protein n=1 Tax=Psychrobacillus sp. FJAT-21963 TaxID=1712028 RepID=UPI0006F9A6B5|nr:hypothetical protein [Psychrobacillus sp. FJAT-21963]KQL34406.1 hypothetical protein AN959_15525 [Psychrobacillus sp. FJAT-21963]
MIRKVKKIFTYPVLAGLLVLGLSLNYLAVEKVDAAYNHLVGKKWSSTSVNYDIAGGFTSDQKSMIKDTTNGWNRNCPTTFNYNLLTGNDWSVENIDSLGLTILSLNSSDNIIKAVTKIDTDPAIATSFSTSSSQYDFTSIARHEWGHWIHLYDDKTHQSTMYESLSKGEKGKLQTAEDIEACNYMY